ncbi:MAG: hypothetical protein A2007_04030 [Verrucomicrobia bacterium GWC2_42_7]|nr:MAG: hypothetical protein A2007_04030 [Verrucomicrobia bacterium GWC2_42_7]
MFFFVKSKVFAPLSFLELLILSMGGGSTIPTPYENIGVRLFSGIVCAIVERLPIIDGDTAPKGEFVFQGAGVCS